MKAKTWQLDIAMRHRPDRVLLGTGMILLDEPPDVQRSLMVSLLFNLMFLAQRRAGDGGLSMFLYRV